MSHPLSHDFIVCTFVSIDWFHILVVTQFIILHSAMVGGRIEIGCKMRLRIKIKILDWFATLSGQWIYLPA